MSTSSQPAPDKGKGKAIPGSQRQFASSGRTVRQKLANSSPYIGVQARLFVDLMPKLSHGKVYTENESSILDDQPPDALPPIDWPDPGDASPHNPFRTMRQLELVNVLQACGPAGVANYLYTECENLKQQGKTHKSLDDMLRDRDNGTKYVRLLLSMLPIPVIESLIKGTLMCDLQSNRDWDRGVGLFVRNRMLNPQQMPGIYMNMLRVPPQNLSGRQQYPGHWLSPDQVRHVLDKYTEYLDEKDQIFNNDIDQMFGGQIEREPRYAANLRAKKISREWIDTARRMYYDNVNPLDQQVPHMSGPSEIGWSRNVKSRIPEHSENAKTTYIFGFNHAISRLPESKGGLGFTSPPTGLTIFPIWEKNNELACIGEILASALTDSLWTSGGFNRTFAGGFSIEEKTSAIDYDAARREAVFRLQACQAPDLLILAATYLADELEDFRSIPAAEKELEDLKGELLITNTDLDRAETSLRMETKKLQIKNEEFHRLQQERYRRIDQRADLNDRQKEVWAAHKRLTEVHESSVRVREHHRAHVLSAVTGKPIRLGPVAARQALNKDETDRLDAKSRQFQARVEERVEAFNRRRQGQPMASMSQQMSEVTNVTTPGNSSPPDFTNLTQVTSPSRTPSSP
ncbi:MAG: hypothetical protein Q9221_003051 [Calogaya cf. arnoldii]